MTTDLNIFVVVVVDVVVVDGLNNFLEKEANMVFILTDT